MRIYEKEGRKYYSVTTVLSDIQDKSLINWKIYDIAKRSLQEGSYQRGKFLHDAYLDNAMLIGTIVHKAIELDTMYSNEKAWEFIINETSNIPDIAVSVINCMNAWQLARSDYEIEIIEAEKVLYGDNYAGTCDAVAKIKGHKNKILIDYKTSSKISHDYFVQLAAYNLIENCEQVAVLRLDKKTGKYEMKIKYNLSKYICEWELRLALFKLRHKEL